MPFSTDRKNAIADAEFVLVGQLKIAGIAVGDPFTMVYADTQVVNGNAAVLIAARLNERATALKPKGAKKARKETTKGQRS